MTPEVANDKSFIASTQETVEINEQICKAWPVPAVAADRSWLRPGAIIGTAEARCGWEGTVVARSVVTISSSYGTGGASIGRQVADRLDVPFLDRAIPAAVAAEVMISFEEATNQESHPVHGLGQWLALFAPLGAAWLGFPDPPQSWNSEAAYLDHTEAVMRRAADQGVVIMGRGASIVLRDHPRALHVRLDGPPERRIAQAMAQGGIDEPTARRAQRETDTARHQYLRHFHHAEVGDPRHYHLYLDVTALPAAVCVELIVTAVRGREEQSRLEGPASSREG